MVWPFGTARNAWRKVSAGGQGTPETKAISAGVINTWCRYCFTGPVFGNMDNFTGLGVFVDTYPNEEKHLEVCKNSTAQI